MERGNLDALFLGGAKLQPRHSTTRRHKGNGSTSRERPAERMLINREYIFSNACPLSDLPSRNGRDEGLWPRGVMLLQRMLQRMGMAQDASDPREAVHSTARTKARPMTAKPKRPAKPAAPKAVDVWCIVDPAGNPVRVSCFRTITDRHERHYGYTVQPMQLIPRPKRGKPAKRKAVK